MRRTRLQDRGEEAALPQLRDGEFHIARFGRERPGPVPVSFCAAGLGALIALGPDVGGEFGLDQLLGYQGDRFADEVEPLAGSECIEQFGQDRLIQGHRW